MKPDSTTLHLFGDMPREVATPKRKVIRRVSEFARFIEENNGIHDCYTSVYPLTGMVDEIFFDLDGPKSLGDTKKMYGWLRNEGYSVIPVASGKKGFHLHILLKPRKYEDEPTESLESVKHLLLRASLSVLSSIFGGGKETSVSVDPHPIGDVRRICRIPNTLRPPENLNWCTYLPPDDFLDMTEEDVARHIKSPHSYEYDFDGKLPELTDFPEPEGFELKTWEPVGYETPIIPSSGNEFLRRVLRPCLYRRILGPMPSHSVRVASTVDLLKHFSSETVFNIYRQLGWADWDPDKTRYYIEHAPTKSYSCRKLRRLGIPSVCCVG